MISCSSLCPRLLVMLDLALGLFGSISLENRWAIVKDKGIARKMLKLMVVMSIGCSHEAQLRATKILDFVSDTYQLDHDHHDHHKTNYNPTVIPASEGLFEFGHRILAERWRKLRTVVQRSRTFGIQHFFPCHCNFLGNISHPNPAFAWMESKTDEDAAKLLSKLKIQVRTGTRFGFNISAKYVRVNMLGSDHTFNLFLERVSALGEH